MAFNYGNRLLLDMNPNATVAYSLRKLKSSYSGPVLTIRRDLDNAETNIGFYRYTLDTQSIANFAGAGSAYVKTWYDQSGNSYNLSQTTSINQPLIYSSGSLQVESTQPSIYFPNSSSLQTNSLPAIPQPISTFRVYKGLDLAAGSFVSFINSAGNSELLTLTSVSTGNNRINAGAILNSSPSVLTYQVNYSEFNSTTSKISANTSFITGNAGTNSLPDLGTIKVGNIRSFTMQEFVVYPTEKTNFGDISKYINYFYRVY